jgi:acyl carrier protein
MNIEQQVIQVIARELRMREDAVIMDSHFKRNLGLDSLDYVALVMMVEDHFNIEIPEERAKKIWNVRGVVQIVEEILLSKTTESPA